ncbi:helix-turn-helix transcriptional regulator [Mycobacterium sp. TY814]|uniref:helix-turn-helix transcriptional regulator n=1 Tax=unclassified Mycobacterium TaxID=2642494 RepID=UPI000F951203|nr:helix-turn-helix transcriptional regulator [Mycobacterium sp. TY814]MDP7725799.1 helix-turn-helix transcriptional regulator [Mycobacterium sp. TY814]RUP04798.1 MAG: AraC family transcriptional regulator [Mycobacterium sp.]
MTTAPYPQETDRSPETRAPDAVRYEKFHTSDSEAAQRFFAQAYHPGWRISSLAGGSSVTHHRFVSEAVTVDELLIEGRVGCEIRATDAAVVIHPRAGSLTLAGDPGTRMDTPVIAADDLPCAIQANTARFHVVQLDLRHLTQVAADRNGPLPQQIRFAGCRPRSTAVARTWSQALDYVIAGFSHAETAQQPLVVGAAGHLLGAALLECFPSNMSDGQDLLRNPSVPPTLKGAISFIHRHAGDGIGVNDVADALRMTSRAVQYLFRQHLETTPTEYLRRVRLHRAHQELVNSDRSTTTVSEVAHRWSFAHTGRFAALYRKTYGQSPHATLQQ